MKSFESLFDHIHLSISNDGNLLHLVSQSNKDVVFNCKLLQNQLNLLHVSAMFGPKRIHLDLADRVVPGNGCWEMPRWGNLSLGRVLIAWACKVSLMISFAFLSEYSFQQISFYASQELQMLSSVIGNAKLETTNWYFFRISLFCSQWYFS